MEYIKLNELCYINIGKTPSRNTSDYWGSGNRWLSISDLKEKYISKSKEEITDLAVEKANMKLVPKNTVVMSFKLSIGRVAILKEDMFTNEAIANFQIKNNELITSEYLYYALRTLNFNNTDRAVMGATLNKSKLNDIKIPYFTICIQNKMVEVLNKAQELIDKRKEQIEALDELVKSRFIEMFGNPFKDEKCFGMNKLGVVTLINPKKAEIKELDKSLNVSFVPMDRVGEKGEFNSEISKQIKEVYSGFTYFKDNDVLFAKITPCMENGKGAVAVNLTNGIGFGSTEFHIIRPIDMKSNPYWIYHLTTLIEFRRLAERKMTGSAGQKRVPTEFINNIQVVVPPIELQNQFADFVRQVDKLKSRMEDSLKELENNFNSLMQKAFKGELFN